MRHPAWPERLAAHIEEARLRPFEWGRHDCVRFAAGAVEAVLGTPPDLPHWGSVREAARALRAVGGMAAGLDQRFARRPLAMAARGDLVLLADGRLVAVCVGSVWAAPGTHGLMFGPMASAQAAWGVDHG